MSQTSHQNEAPSLEGAFEDAATAKNATPHKSTKRISPLSVRFTEAERAMLQERAGQQSLSAYVRDTVLDGKAVPRRKSQTTSVDHALIGKALGLLGKSRLSQNMNQIAKGINQATLPLTPDVLLDVKDACEDIRLMHKALLIALGLQGE